MREPGYYWVKSKDGKEKEWEIFLWLGSEWFVCYQEWDTADEKWFSAHYEIDERRIEREERNNNLEEAIVFLGKQFPEYGNKEFSITEIRKLLQSIKKKNPVAIPITTGLNKNHLSRYAKNTTYE